MSSQRLKSIYGTMILLVLLFTVSYNYAAAGTINVTSGQTYYARIETLSDTINWAGLQITNNAVDLDPEDANTPFTSLVLAAPIITEVQFPGANFKDGQHYYAAMMVNGFNLNNVQNITAADLFPNAIFDATNFPQFYPNYNNESDNPDLTFCCNFQDMELGGVNFSSFEIELNSSISYYLLKYNDSGTDVPLFLVDIADATCYNGTACVGHFLLPVSNETYYFYALSKIQEFAIDVFVDDVETTTIAQTALPYVVRLVVRDVLTNLTQPNLSVFIAEQEAHNLFIPYRYAGSVGEAYAVAISNSSGEQTFLVSPSSYSTNGNYSIFAGVLQGDSLTSRKTITVTEGSSAVSTSQQVSPLALNNEGKAAVNALNQLVSFMFEWANDLPVGKAKQFIITYETNNNSFDFQNIGASDNSMLLKSGAPNVLTVVVETGGGEQAGYEYTIRETGGFMMLNPYTGSSPLDRTMRVHRMTFPADSGEFSIIAPTNSGSLDSNITLEIYTTGGSLVDNVTLALDTALDTDFDDTVNFNDNNLKALINSMNILISSLFTAFNT